MTTEALDTAPAAAPPGPLREFWHYFSANTGAVAGLVVIVAVLATVTVTSLRATRKESPRVGDWRSGSRSGEDRGSTAARRSAAGQSERSAVR